MRSRTLLEARLGIALVAVLINVVAAGAPSHAEPAPGSLRIVQPTPGALVTPESTLTAWLAPGGTATVDAVEFWFTPADGGTPMLVGRATPTPTPLYGPACDPRSPCTATGDFSIPTDGLRNVPEGRGSISVRPSGARTDVDSVAVYWDSTPPKLTFQSPTFMDTGIANKAWIIRLKSAETNLRTAKVVYKVADPNNRNVPPLEQHATGYMLTNGGHASCVPTAVSANLRWVDNSGPASVGGAWLSDLDLVTNVGKDMGTAGGGTSGAGAVNGTEEWLSEVGANPWSSCTNICYSLEHSYVPGGIPISTMLNYFYDGWMINLGIHNLPGDSPFGHFVALDNIIWKPNGTALIRIMDPNIEPPGQPHGAYRWFTLNADGTIAWDGNAISYGFPESGKYRIDEILAVGDWGAAWGWPAYGQATSSSASTTATQSETEIPGVFLPDGSWIGVFVPPVGQSGPFLLKSYANDTAGNTEVDRQVVGG